MKKIYIAGPMQGYKDFNFPAFFAVHEKLEAEGWHVFNPAKKDIDVHGEDVAVSETGDLKDANAKGFSLRNALLWDTAKICESDGIYMLPGWESSFGAKAEHALATALKRAYPDFQIIYG